MIACVEPAQEPSWFSFRSGGLRPEDVARADEVLLASTPVCLLPVTRLNGRPIGDGEPGEVFRRLLAAWSDLVGVDVSGQAKRFAGRDLTHLKT